MMMIGSIFRLMAILSDIAKKKIIWKLKEKWFKTERIALRLWRKIRNL